MLPGAIASFGEVKYAYLLVVSDGVAFDGDAALAEGVNVDGVSGNGSGFWR